MFKFIIGLPVLALSLSLYGQQGNFSFGVQGGPMFATIKQDPDLLDPKFRTAFFAGANARYAFGKHWAVQGDVQFSQRGYQYNTPGTPIILNGQLAIYKGRIDQKISYVDVITQVEFRPVKYIGISVGPYVSWKVGEAVRYGDVVGWTKIDDELSLVKDVDFGASAKLSGHFGPATLFVSWLHGLVETSMISLSDENGTSLGWLTTKSRALAVGAGYSF